MQTTKRFRHYLLGSLCLLFSLTTLPSATAAPAEQTAVFAGGCFWGVDAVFKHVKGVSEVVSGYAGGSEATAHYAQVSDGDTGHAEAVRVRFNPEQVSYQQLLQVFFSVAHNPTELNRQGPDTGSQYRSAIFHTSVEQQKMAQSTIQQLTAARTFSRPIVTQVVPLQQFYPAEAYHQNYLALHPTQPYIVIHDKPKLEQLRKQFPALYTPAEASR
ncbi:peptide methionine sulfoxide reductase [Sulfuricella denitrificans skB26]|uniref:Peptide methionine sulfoxide reductase MsrA n=1 Tax=Sulfuricella denitrificans (strain DSM 22764 / NBRC 105220 / skB26) TaxID=1163617 RepID=S6AJB8_SULDS|nr:peptide-methionine (S)-S-oxide reductase MsrA [Sulfuricella denitrificans]BAN36416.1 peptide methionine sulfoxide reductase [Sulfuricella denitrificans skB26]